MRGTVSYHVTHMTRVLLKTLCEFMKGDSYMMHEWWVICWWWAMVGVLMVLGLSSQMAPQWEAANSVAPTCPPETVVSSELPTRHIRLPCHCIVQDRIWDVTRTTADYTNKVVVKKVEVLWYSWVHGLHLKIRNIYSFSSPGRVLLLTLAKNKGWEVKIQLKQPMLLMFLNLQWFNPSLWH